jgi:diguanylate cyclase (GGDEF)-like protein
MVVQTRIATDRLAVRATHDELTMLPNRAYVLDRLRQALARLHGTAGRMAVLFVDLDRFKSINESLGHEIGDQVLRAVALRLTRIVRGGDTVARLSGDEFVVIVEERSATDDVLALAERIVAALSQPIVISVEESGLVEREVAVGASVGVALADGRTPLAPADMLRDADVAMYHAKQRGRGRVEVFGDALRTTMEQRTTTRDELRRGIGTGQLRVHYQPIVDTSAGRYLGFEALARWQHPTRGLLHPAEFIDVAEDSGLIVTLGAAVVAEGVEDGGQVQQLQWLGCATMQGYHFGRPVAADLAWNRATYTLEQWSVRRPIEGPLPTASRIAL